MWSLLVACQVYTPDQLPQLMADSDYVVAALPSTPATQQLINAEAIKAMRPHAVFVNVGRGVTLDEEALITGQPSLTFSWLCYVLATARPSGMHQHHELVNFAGSWHCRRLHIVLDRC